MNDPNDVDEPCEHCNGFGFVPKDDESTDAIDCPKCNGTGISATDLEYDYRDDYSMLPE